MSGFNFGGGSGGGFSFGGASTTSSATPSSTPAFSFGTPAASTTGATTGTPAFGGTTSAAPSIGGAGASGTTSLFGAGGSGTSATQSKFSFGAGTPAAKTDAPSAASGGFSFGGAATSQPATSAPSGFSFGGASAAPSTPAPAKSATGGLFTTPAPTSVPQSPLTLSALKTPAPTTSVATAPASTPAFKMPGAPASSNLFGGGAQPSATSNTTNAAPASSSTASVEFKVPAVTTATTSASNTSATTTEKKEKPETIQKPAEVPATSILSTLRGKTLGEILSDWQNELHDSVSLFHRKASEIANLDTKILENSDAIYRLVLETQKLNSLQSNLGSTLDYIESQQTQLDKELDAFESKLRALISSDSGAETGKGRFLQQSAGVSAQDQREKTYELAENLTHEVVQISQQVNEMIGFVNDTWRQSENADLSEKEDSIVLINKILNEHFNNLKWIDQTTTQLKQRYVDMKQAAQKMETQIDSIGISTGRKR